MRKFIVAIALLFEFCLLAGQAADVVANEDSEDSFEVSLIDIDVIKQKAAEWAELYLKDLSEQDRIMLRDMLKVSNDYTGANLKVKQTVRVIFDLSCLIQDKAHRFVGISEDTELIKKMAEVVGVQVQVYNEQLQQWAEYVDKVNGLQDDGILEALRGAEASAEVYVKAFLEAHQEEFFKGVEDTVTESLKHGELLKTISLSLVDSLYSKADVADVSSSSFELARSHFCTEVRSIIRMRRLFEVQEQLLALRKIVVNAFYQACMPSCIPAVLG